MSAKSSRNAVTHGIHTNVLVLRNENNEDFLETRGRYLALWHPVGPLERVLVDQMIAAEWRLRRTWQTETAAVDLQMDRDAPAIEKELGAFDEPVRAAVAFTHMSDESLLLDNMHRYETRFTRQIDRAAAPSLRPAGKARPPRWPTPDGPAEYDDSAKRNSTERDPPMMGVFKASWKARTGVHAGRAPNPSRTRRPRGVDPHPRHHPEGRRTLPRNHRRRP